MNSFVTNVSWLCCLLAFYLFYCPERTVGWCTQLRGRLSGSHDSNRTPTAITTLVGQQHKSPHEQMHLIHRIFALSAFIHSFLYPLFPRKAKIKLLNPLDLK